MSRRMVFFILLLVRVTQNFSCAFHQFPPFGADWYHESIFRMLFNSDKERFLGVSYTYNYYAKHFEPEPEFAGEKVHPVLLQEQMVHRNLFYKFRFCRRLECMMSVTMTDIRSQALTDDGPVAIGSSSGGQASVFLTYNIPIVERSDRSLEIKVVSGIQTSCLAVNTFYSHIGWLKYQWNSVSTRLVAGNYTNTASLGASLIYRVRRVNIYPGLSARWFAENKEGVKYGADFNSFFLAGYKMGSRSHNAGIEPYGGIFFESGARDKKAIYCQKDERTLASGNALSLIGGLRLSYKTLGVGFTGHIFILQKNYAEFQFYNSVRASFYICIGF